MIEYGARSHLEKAVEILEKLSVVKFESANQAEPVRRARQRLRQSRTV